MTAIIRVGLGEGGYDVAVGFGLRDQVGPVARRASAPGAARAFVLIDAGVPRAFTDRVLASLREHGFSPSWSSIEPSESVKNFATLETILSHAAAGAQERGEPFIAVGGGIVCDLGGLAAALYRRGVPLILAPTTLLAMADAAIGGKNAVNLSLGGGAGAIKNAAGTFYQPAAVLADLDALQSLPPREFHAGLAECVKHALIAGLAQDPHYLEWIERHAPSILAGHSPTVGELVRRSVAIKAKIVQGDERERSEAADAGRKALNLGHTFAHAIETLPLKPALNHGEAVALGLVAACHLAAAVGLAQASLLERTRTLLTALSLPTHHRALPEGDSILARMRHDKKNRGGALRLIVPTDDRQARVITDAPAAAVLAAIDAVRG